jgi:hypothetical protein
MTISDSYSRFVIGYDNCNKMYIEATREDFFKYLRAVTTDISQYNHTNNSWTHRIWFLDGTLSFNARHGTEYQDTEVEIEDKGAKSLAYNMLLDGYDFYEIYAL